MLDLCLLEKCLSMLDENLFRAVLRKQGEYVSRTDLCGEAFNSL